SHRSGNPVGDRHIHSHPDGNEYAAADCHSHEYAGTANADIHELPVAADIYEHVSSAHGNTDKHGGSADRDSDARAIPDRDA
ncbi:MAG: hypothetical protein MUP15_05975, partial [Dehalococcoidia bacterium]|nr:hypothetical protein [Dehalococcoidia bacterium]